MNMVNDQGGVAGHKINLLSVDDGYNPPKTVEQVRKLVEEDQVAILFQTIGTAPNTAIVKYTNAKKVPNIWIGSGSSVFADPKKNPVEHRLPAQLPRRRARCMPSTSWTPSPTPRSASCTRTTIWGATTCWA